MRYAPYQNEYLGSVEFNDQQQLEYFLTRVFETEEVWGLDDGTEWVFKTLADGSQVMPVWPYNKFATEALNTSDMQIQPQAESLEDFLYHTLEMLIEEDVSVEVMPSATKAGCIITPHQLLSILTGMIDAGEYRMDG